MAEHPTGIPILLEPLVTRVLAPNPSPFTFTGTQSYVVGDTDVAVIDPSPRGKAMPRQSGTCLWTRQYA